MEENASNPPAEAPKPTIAEALRVMPVELAFLLTTLLDPGLDALDFFTVATPILSIEK